VTVLILRTDGRRESYDMPQAEVFDRLRGLLNAEGFDTVNLRDGRVMIVDDDGYDVEVVVGIQDGFHVEERRPMRAKKPVNVEATALYHGVCKPGTTHQIVGDVAIVADAAFA